jgi:hypothetical protein
VKNAFVSVCGKIAKMLQVSLGIQDRAMHDLLVMQRLSQSFSGKLNFATNAWTLPNHKAYVALTIHLKHDGKPLSMLLDVVEVPRSHSGMNLVLAFADVLQTFRIKDKV